MFEKNLFCVSDEAFTQLGLGGLPADPGVGLLQQVRLQSQGPML
jgi:hypothetical protein